MIRTDKIRGLIAERGLSQAKVAQELGMNENTFYRKMKKGIFGSDEIEEMIKLLKIDDPSSIFFAQE